MNLSQARYNMVEQQIRPWHVLDDNVLNLFMDTPREHFVPPLYRSVAYADFAVPLGHGQTMQPPATEGRILQALQIKRTDKVLEIGVGSGFTTALLGKAAANVIGLEIREDFTEAARSKLLVLGLNNIELLAADGARGWELDAPYDVILISASMPEYLPVFQQQLRMGGRLFVVVGESPAMEARLVTRTGDQEWITQTLFETDIPPLAGLPPAPRRMLC